MVGKETNTSVFSSDIFVLQGHLCIDCNQCEKNIKASFSVCVYATDLLIQNLSQGFLPEMVQRLQRMLKGQWVSYL